MAVGPVPGGGLGHHGQQRRLGIGQPVRPVVEIGKAGRLDPLDHPAKGGVVQIVGENPLLGKTPLQLQGGEDLGKLA